jgi:hypothetical protein
VGVMGVVVMVTARRPCPPAPGPLEEYATRFDDLWHSLAQRRGFREYLAGLLSVRICRRRTHEWLQGVRLIAPGLFAHWRLRYSL